MPAFPFLLTDFDVDRILSLENAKLGTLFTVLVSVGEETAGACLCTRTAGRTVPSRPAFYRIFRLLYIPSSTYTGNFWCLHIWQQFVCEKCEMLTDNFKDFFLTARPVPNKLQLHNSLKYSLLCVLKIFTVLYRLASSLSCTRLRLNCELSVFWTSKIWIFLLRAV